ncbi:MAG: GxxExxY protein [Patescibacteria group bacterium]
MPRIIQKELSYKIMGILFSVHNELGNRYQEKYYQRAIEEGLKQEKLNFKKELSVDLLYNGKKIGKYFLDFLIEDKVILEIKTVDRLKPKDFKQVLGYLTANNMELGILVNFRTDRLSFKRILNSKYSG